MAQKNYNYTTVCWYCGVIFQNNRRSGKYCDSKHRSLYKKNGPRVPSTVFDRRGRLINADDRLSEVYKENKVADSDWSMPYISQYLHHRYDYLVPLPKGEELLLVGSYVIKKIENLSNRYNVEYSVKPFIFLTLEERTIATICRGEGDSSPSAYFRETYFIDE